MFRRLIVQSILLIGLALFFLVGCGVERESTVLVTDSSRDESTGSASSEKTDSRPFGHGGEEVEPFGEGSDPLSGKGSSEDAKAESGMGTASSGTSSEAAESGTGKKSSFLEKLFHREPTTLDDSEREILRQARLVYLVFKEKKLLAREKAKKIRSLLQEVGCEVVVRFCGGKSENVRLAIRDAVANGAGTVILEFPGFEPVEEEIALARNAGVRFITIGETALPGLQADAVMLPDETMGVRAMALEAAELFPNGSYLFAGGKTSDQDLAELFDESLGAIGRPFARAGDLSNMITYNEEFLSVMSNVLADAENLRFVLCPDTASAQELSSALIKLKRKDVGILCLYGEDNILELMEKGRVKASVVMDTDMLAMSVMNAFDNLAEKGNAGDYSLCYINTAVRAS